MSKFDIGAIREGDYYVKFHLCNKDDNFKWALVVIYGPADEKQLFLEVSKHVLLGNVTNYRWW
jgi:hypothetical protein